MDTMNKFLVSRQGEFVLMLNPPKMGEPFSKQDALLFAAWLVAISAPDNDEFENILRAVKST